MAKKAAKWSFKDFVVAVLLIVFLVWLVYLNISIFHKEQIAQSTSHATSVQLSSLDSREKVLQQNVNELSTERGQEATLRETYGVVRPGEGVIVIVSPTTPTTTPPESFWQKYFGWLKFW